MITGFLGVAAIIGVFWIGRTHAAGRTAARRSSIATAMAARFMSTAKIAMTSSIATRVAKRLRRRSGRRSGLVQLFRQFTGSGLTDHSQPGGFAYGARAGNGDETSRPAPLNSRAVAMRSMQRLSGMNGPGITPIDCGGALLADRSRPLSGSYSACGKSALVSACN
jgi:hypothetical protein